MQKGFFPTGAGTLLLDLSFGIFEADPFEQIKDIVKMIIESHAVNAAVFYDLSNCDLVQRLL